MVGGWVGDLMCALVFVLQARYLFKTMELKVIRGFVVSKT